MPGVGVELVDHRRDDPALALHLRHVGGAAILRAAFAEEALQVDFGPLVIAAARAAPGDQHHQDQEQPLHRTAVPAMAPTICFWNRM
jgi:hypothetical protein